MNNPELQHEARVEVADTYCRVHRVDLHGGVRNHFDIDNLAVVLVLVVEALADERDGAQCVFKVFLLLEHALELQLQADTFGLNIEFNGLEGLLVLR